MERKYLFPLFALFLGTALTFTACQSDDDEDPSDEQELITTVVVTFTDADGQTSIFQSSDPDGVGGNDPVVDDITLDANTDYTIGLAFLDESGSETEIITEEVMEEAEEHLVCYEVTGGLPRPAIQDLDANGDPLGLVATLTTGDAGTGTLRITLKHEPAKDAADPCTTGETDVDQVFDVTVQ